MSGKQLTARQQEYANAIIGAKLAERDEVEDAFRQRTEESEAKIALWGRTLAHKRKEEQQERLRRLRRQERCAYPGCTNSIEVGRTSLYELEMPRPTRWVTLTVQMEGWHWEGFLKEPNTKTITTQLYGCSPEHQEGIFHLDFVLTPTLAEPNDQEHRIQYPMGSETQWRVYELARKRAQDLVVQAKQLTGLPRMRRTIEPLAQQEVEALIALSDTAWLTDDLEQFRKVYTEEFVEGYLAALRTRKRAEEKKW